MPQSLLVAIFSIRNFQRCRFISFEACFFGVRRVFASDISRYPSAESNLWCGLNVNGLVLNGIRHLLELCIWIVLYQRKRFLSNVAGAHFFSKFLAMFVLHQPASFF